ncbi:hypothetical protein CW304_23765 [Bacillus sp. UFRGS-B20]|nr:hypothetical protein CW304_23765 [Bacillus sp. UFRGS-B20]
MLQLKMIKVGLYIKMGVDKKIYQNLFNASTGLGFETLLIIILSLKDLSCLHMLKFPHKYISSHHQIIKQTL